MRLYTKDRYSGPWIRGLYTYRNQGSGAGAGSTQNWFHSKQRSRETLQDTTVLGQGQGFVHSKKGTLKILKNEAKIPGSKIMAYEWKRQRDWRDRTAERGRDGNVTKNLCH